MTSEDKSKRRHLGRGLEALLGPMGGLVNDVPPAGPTPSSGPVQLPPDEAMKQALRTLPISQIRANPYQPRQTWSDADLEELAASIQANGVIQPVLVRKKGTGYELIAGERRLRAASIAGLEEVPAVVRDATDEEMLELALVENIHRTDLNPIERAMAYQNYIHTFSLSQTEAAERLGEDRSVVANYLRLLDLPQDIRAMLIEGQLAMGHARAILALPTDELRRKLAHRALAGRLSVREVERLVKMSLEGAREPKAKEKSAHIMDLERRLKAALGTKVKISAGKRGNRGRIIIEYSSLDEFERLTERMGVNCVD
ncbi:MAG TPA: ParB/RepB/Spo0J family partition protein [Anaerohalosphaeraceae bacterium]|jgi:ParB family chromosome partitioning protein|nr:ParB/RepB/Spo0J family partition protein [Anaerohalosphaeraceae bacterium]HRT48939.1 ParB/RepB/Spo0J family partition protein [Anaerohalosphaeraceae bacterium]HRT85062.1 ParB/RepB/Spo0J family partition protein [Anaerohalosphaeraceae bacterium]